MSSIASNADRDNAFSALESMLSTLEQLDKRITFTPDELKGRAAQIINDGRTSANVVHVIECLCDDKLVYDVLCALATTDLSVPRAQALVAQWMQDNAMAPISIEQAHKILQCTGSVSIARALLADPRVDPTHDNSAAIRLDVDNYRAEIVRLLIDDGRADPTADDNAAIHRAAENGHTEIVRLLLANERVDPTTDNNKAIRWAACNGNTEVVRLLLADERVDPTAND